MCASCQTIAPGLRLAAALATGPTQVVARPAPTGHAHLHAGPFRPDGRADRTVRPLCGRRRAGLRHLHALPLEWVEYDDGRARFRVLTRTLCARCVTALPAATHALTGDPVHAHIRGTYANPQNTPSAVYGHLPAEVLEHAARWARTTDECHQIGTTLLTVHGPKPYAPRGRLNKLPNLADLWDAHDVLDKRRSRLRIRELDPDTRAQVVADRGAATANARQVDADRRTADRIDHLASRHRKGLYLTPWERDELNATRSTA